MIKVKICGVSSESSVSESVKLGVNYIGFVFYTKSPRSVSIDKVSQLSELIPKSVKKVGLFVNPKIKELEKKLSHISLDYLQLHGHETLNHVTEIKEAFAIPIIKAIGISEKADLGQIEKYEEICDQLLIDTKPSPSMTLPGGNGTAFDWGLISNRQFYRPWFLAGGLNASNVSEAIRVSGAKQVDVSSGVEERSGVKDNTKIAEFIKAAKMSV